MIFKLLHLQINGKWINTDPVLLCDPNEINHINDWQGKSAESQRLYIGIFHILPRNLFNEKRGNTRNLTSLGHLWVLLTGLRTMTLNAINFIQVVILERH